VAAPPTLDDPHRRQIPTPDVFFRFESHSFVAPIRDIPHPIEMGVLVGLERRRTSAHVVEARADYDPAGRL
jgi:hypothetical protein